MLEVATHIWNQGGDFASIPSRKDFELPTPPVRPESALGSAGDEVSTGSDGTTVTKTAKNTYPAEMRAYMQERRRVEKLNRELHALRCDANYKLEIAKAVRVSASIRSDDAIRRQPHATVCINFLLGATLSQFATTPFYFPHSLDFRGRAYPIPPHLNHVGSDLCRGLLLFAEGKPLGERGLFWLKVHLANLMGQDK